VFGSEHRPFDYRVILIGEMLFLCVLGLIFYLSRDTEHNSRTERVRCHSNLKLIALEARLLGHPDSPLVFELSALRNNAEATAIKPTMLLCPSDTNRTVAVSWDSLTPENITYEVVTPGLAVTNTDSPFLHCPIHGLVVFADGRVK